MSRLFFGGTRQGRRTATNFGFPMICVWGWHRAPFFMPIRGAYFQQSHEVMEPRRARNAINYTDCPRPLLGSGRNRYVPVASACRGSMINRYARVPAGAAERDKLTWHSYYPAAPFFGLFSQFHYYNRKVISLHRHSANGKVRLLRSCELIRPKLLRPFVEFHKAIFWVGGWDPYSHPPFFESFPPII